MNLKLIAFSSIVTAFLGAGIGFVTPHLFPCPYTSQMYHNLDQKYAIAGIFAGLLIGSSQEMIRELKQERDEQDDLMRDWDTVIHSSTNKKES
jgi:hypothetical protein